MSNLCNKVLLENELTIEQDLPFEADSFSCQLNSFFITLSQLINALDIEKQITIDIKKFFICNKDKWSRFQGPRNDYINNLELSLAAAPKFQKLQEPQKTNTIQKIVDSAKVVFQVLQWLRSVDPKITDNRIIIPYGGGSVKRKTVTIPFSCEPIPLQKYSDIDLNEKIDCNNDCILELNILYEFGWKTTVAKLMSYLQQGQPIICGLNIDLNNNYTINKNNDDSSKEVIAIIDDLSQNIGKDHHAVCCIGFECIENYIEFTFQDFYSYGTTIKRPGIFKVKVNQNMLYSLAPFGVGAMFLMDSQSTLLSCSFQKKQIPQIQKEINEKIKKCCSKWYCINNKCVQKFPDDPEVAELTPFETEAECNCDSDSDSTDYLTSLYIHTIP
jgi:hypothetical protein